MNQSMPTTPTPSQVPQPQTLQTQALQPQTLQPHARPDRSAANGWRWVVLGAAVLGTLVVIAVLTALLAPNLRSVLMQEVATASQSFEIGGGSHNRAASDMTATGTTATDGAVRVTPDEGWVVQPVMNDALRLYSPDREFVVVLMPSKEDRATRLFESMAQPQVDSVGATTDASSGDATDASSGDASSGAATDTPASSPAAHRAAQRLTETLANGAVLTHIDDRRRIVGELRLGDAADAPTVLFDAAVIGEDGSIDRYRATLSQLLLQIEAR